MFNTNPMEQFEHLSIWGINYVFSDYLFSLIKYDIFFNLFFCKYSYITNFLIYLIFITILIFLFFYLNTLSNDHIKYTNFQLFSFQLMNFVNKIIKENLNIYFYYIQWEPYLFYLFFFIAFANILSLIPYTFALTSHILVTLILALLSITLINKAGIQRQGIYLFELFLPSGVPLFIAPFLIIIEFISYHARIFSLSIRLFANIMAGHILLKILSGFAFSTPIYASIFIKLVICIIFFLEIVIALLQAYVFLTLVAIFLREVISMHQ